MQRARQRGRRGVGGQRGIDDALERSACVGHASARHLQLSLFLVRWVSVVSCVLLLQLAAVVTRAQSVTAMDPAASALQEQVDALLQPEGASVRGGHIAWAEWIHEFYARRSFRPVWTNDHASAELLRAIEDSRLDGLDPHDYHLLLLRQLDRDVAAPTVNAAVRAQRDVLQTDALLRLGHHLAFGKVDPESFDARWNYGRSLEQFDIAGEIDAALAATDIYARIEALKPKHRLYVALKAELRRYRDAAAAGDSAVLPAGPTLRASVSDARIPVLRARLVASGDLPSWSSSAARDVFDAALEHAVRRFQERMGLEVDGMVGARTRKELNIPLAQRILTLRVNLDRGRALLQDLPPAFVVVNIAGYLVYVVRGEQIVWRSRVQVGTPYRRTPIFRSEISYLVFNPTWTVPPGIIRRDILPDARRDPHSITQRGLRVLDHSGMQIDPATIDWMQYRSGHIPYTLRQDSGPNNAMGGVKIMFPNPYFVYLHDTPSKARFEAAERSFSSGCVRVERPLELATLLLDDSERWNPTTMAQAIATGRTQNVTLKKRVPVLLVYWTAWVDEQDRPNFRRDVYRRDDRWAAGLDTEFSIRQQSVAPSDEQEQRSQRAARRGTFDER